MRLTRPAAALAASIALTLGLAACQSSGTNANASPDNATSLDVGDKAPRVTLTAADGQRVRLSTLNQSGPLVVNFYRGNWCPYCVTSLNEWEAAADDFAAAGATIIAISPESLPNVRKTGADHSYRIFSDPDHRAAKAFDINFTVDPETQIRYEGYGIDLQRHNADGAWDLPIPATYVIDAEGTIQYVYANPDYRTRVQPGEVLAIVQGLN